MNIAVLIFGVFYIIYGIFGLFGVQNTPDKFRDRAWTRRYTRLCGVYDLLLGVPWALAWLALRGAAMGVPRQIAVYVALALSLALDVRCRRLVRLENAALKEVSP